MTKYKHLFFDLDHTLWDFETNATQTLTRLYDSYKLDNYFNSYDHFIKLYKPINVSLWEKYRRGSITKQFLNTERFYQPMLAVGFDNHAIAQQFAHDFITTSPLQTALLPHAIEVLSYLAERYTMHIITNGFRETQLTKMGKSGLAPYFSRIYISEMIGAQKPERDFFDYAIKSSNARKIQSLVIGDNLEVDVIGAMKAGIHAVYFNPAQQQHNQKPTFEIDSLLKLKEFL